MRRYTRNRRRSGPSTGCSLPVRPRPDPFIADRHRPWTRTPAENTVTATAHAWASGGDPPSRGLPLHPPEVEAFGEFGPARPARARAHPVPRSLRGSEVVVVG